MRRTSTDSAAAPPALLVAERRQAALHLRDRAVHGGEVLRRAGRQRPVELGQRARGRQRLGALDQAALELAPQVALEAVELLAVDRRLAPVAVLGLRLRARPTARACGGSAARRRRPRPSPRRGGRRRRSPAAPGRASRRRFPRRSPGGSARAARRGRAARRPRGAGLPSPTRARPPPPRRRGRSSGRTAARRPAGPPATWRSSPPAPRGSPRARSRAPARAPRRRRGSPRCRPRRPRRAAPRRRRAASGPARAGRPQPFRAAVRPAASAKLHPDPLGDQVDVGAVLDDDRDRLLEGLAVDVVGAHQQQRARPVDRLGDRGRLLQVELADHLDDLDQPPGERLVELRRVQADDLHLALELGVVEPEVEAAPLQRLGQLARVVRGEDDDRHRRRRDLAQLGDRDLEVGEQLEQHRLELLVGLVDLVDQQDDRARRWRSPASAAARAGTPR